MACGFFSELEQRINAHNLDEAVIYFPKKNTAHMYITE
jgi:hypothetical protein